MTVDPIFEPLQLGPLHLANRIVALPVFTGYAIADGRVSSLLIEHYAELARSGAGLVMVANVSVRGDGTTSRHCLRLDDDRFIAGLAQLARAIHRGGARAGLQLNHAGRLALTERPLLPAPLNGANLAFNISALKNFMHFFPVEARFGLTRRFLNQAGAWRQAMATADRRQVAKDFAAAADRAARAGFDLVELHGASGYLLSQFLSAFTNPSRGTGGSRDLIRRLAFPLAVFVQVRRRLWPSVPLGWRLMLHEFVPGGIDPDQAMALGRRLAAAGAAYVSVSAGTFNSIFSREVQCLTDRPGHLGPDCAVLRQALSIPVIAAGRIVTPAVARRLVVAGHADLVGLGRPLRADFRWLENACQGRPVRQCRGCNWCLRRVVLEQGFGCVRWPQLQMARTDLARQVLARCRHWLWIVIGGADMARYRALAPLLQLAAEDDPATAPATVLFLRRPLAPAMDERIEAAFCHWVKETFSPLGRQEPVRLHLAVPGRRTEVLQDLVRRKAFAGVVWCRDDGESWRRRLLYRPRGRATLMLGPTGGAERILVPVDLSETSLLQLALVGRMMAACPALRIDLVHVAVGSERDVQRRWATVRRIVQWPDKPLLNIIAATGDVAGDLVRQARNGRYTTVVMGKRGLSGVKRLLLGSVSAAVLSGLPDSTVFLVD